MTSVSVDLELYIRLVDFFEALEHEGKWMGMGEASFEWFSVKYDRDDPRLDYVLRGCLRLVDHWKAEQWEKEPRDEVLDQQVWTFHRVWVDRYGWEATMREGKERHERYEAQLKPR